MTRSEQANLAIDVWHAYDAAEKAQREATTARAIAHWTKIAKHLNSAYAMLRAEPVA